MLGMGREGMAREGMAREGMGGDGMAWAGMGCVRKEGVYFVLHTLAALLPCIYTGKYHISPTLQSASIQCELSLLLTHVYTADQATYCSPRCM